MTERTIVHQRHITKTLIRDEGASIVLHRQVAAQQSPSGQLVKADRRRTPLDPQNLAFLGVSQDLIRGSHPEGGKTLDLKWNLIGMPGADIEPGDTFQHYGIDYYVHEVVPDQRWEVRAWVREYGPDAVQG